MRMVQMSEWSNGCPYAEGSWAAFPQGATVSGLFLIDTGANISWIDEDIAKKELHLRQNGSSPSFGSDGEHDRPVFNVRVVLNATMNASPSPITIPMTTAIGRSGFSASFSNQKPPKRVIGAIGMDIIRHGILTIDRTGYRFEFP